MNVLQKLILIGSWLMAGQEVFAAGTVLFGNNGPTPVSTNGSGGIGLIPSRNPSVNPPSYYFGLFIAPYGATDNQILDEIWTFTGQYGTNQGPPGVFRGNLAASIDGWETGTEMSFMVAGWSADLGHDWPAIRDQLEGDNWIASGFFGQSDIGWGTAGGVPSDGGPSIPPFQLFSLIPSEGALTHGFTLYQVPEPRAVMLLALLLGFLASRRRCLTPLPAPPPTSPAASS